MWARSRETICLPIPSRPALMVEEIIIRYTRVVLEEGMATHFSILSWWIPWIEEPEGLQSMGSQIVRHDWSDLVCTHTWVEIQLLPSYSLDDLGKFLHIKVLHTHSNMCVCVGRGSFSTSISNFLTPTRCPTIYLSSDAVFLEIASDCMRWELSPRWPPCTIDASHKLRLLPVLLIN